MLWSNNSTIFFHSCQKSSSLVTAIAEIFVHDLISTFRTFDPPPPPRLFLVIFGRRALIFFLFERSWKKWKITPLLCACAVVITLETQKCRKRAPHAVEFNFFIIGIDRNGFRRMKEKKGRSTKGCLRFFKFLPRDLVTIFQSLVMILPRFFDFERP